MNAPYEAFETGDGYLLIAAGNNPLWQKLCHAIGRPELLEDPRYVDNPDRVRNRDQLAADLTKTLRTASTAYWVTVLQNAGVPCSPIRTLDEVVADPQVEHLRILRSVEHPQIERYRDIRLPLAWDGERPATRRVPPALGSDTRAILESLGRTPEEIAELREQQVIITPPEH